MNELFARQEICRIGQSLFSRGLVHSSAGNISVRLADGFLITPTDAVLGFLDPERISKVDLNGQHISGDKPSKTLSLHQAIVRAALHSHPSTTCVIHTHSTYCVALTLQSITNVPTDQSLHRELLPPITPYLSLIHI